MRAAHRSRALRGEQANGDRALVLERHGELLVAIIDGLGHGPVAETAALRAVEVLETAPANTVLEVCFANVHAALRGTRGAAMSALRWTAREIETAGVGNVTLRSVGAEIPHLLTPGILGGSMRPLRVSRAPPPLSGRVILHSDGVSARFDASTLAADVEVACDELLARHASVHDDATVIIVDL